MILARTFLLICVLTLVATSLAHSAETATLPWEWTSSEQKRITDRSRR